MLRIFAIIAPSTAASRSASSNTRNGALPPSSIETRRICSAACSISLRPTSVEPVKLSLRSRKSEMIGFDTSLELELVITFSTPPGSPTSSRICATASALSGVRLGRLQHHRAAGGDRRADLARRHRGGEVPGRDQVAGPDRLLHHEQAALTGGRDLEAAVDPHRLLGEPAEELGRVGDLGLRLGDRLAHLERHQQREVVGALDHRPRRRGAGSRRARAAGARPTRPAARARPRAPPARRRAWRRRPRRSSRRWPGSSTGKVLPAGAVHPLAADQQLLRHRLARPPARVGQPLPPCASDRASSPRPRMSILNLEDQRRRARWRGILAPILRVPERDFEARSRVISLDRACSSVPPH